MTASTKRLTRHEIKEPDHFQVAMDQGLRYLRSHPLPILGGLAAVVVLGGALLGFLQWQRVRERTASMALGNLVATETRPVGAPAATEPRPAASPFATAKERAEAVLSQSDQMLRDQGGSQAARGARVLRAQALAELGRYDDAAVAYQELAGTTPTDAVGVSAAFGRAHALAAAGKTEAAVDELKRLASLGSPFVPKDYALKTAAAIAERAGAFESALSLYRRIVDEAADSPAAGEAKPKIEELSAKVQAGTASQPASASAPMVNSPSPTP